MSTYGLFAALDYSQVPDDEFNEWYDSEHLPERVRIKGFMNCERWIGATNAKYSLGNYDLESLDVLKSEPYLAISGKNTSPWTKRVIGRSKRLFRVVGEQVLPGNMLAPADAGGLLIAATNIAPEFEDEFIEFQTREHIPSLSQVPGTLSARFFRGAEGSSHRYISIYHLTEPDVPNSTAWRTAARTPWTEKILPQLRDRVRIEFRSYRRET